MSKTNASAPSPAEQSATDATPVVPRHRSPNYPVYRLDTAIKKTQLLAEEFKRHRVPVEAAAKKIGFTSPKSSSASQAIAALKAYGLIEVHGTGDKRQVAVSEVGHKIIGNHSDRKALIEKAALAPALHAELFNKFMDEHDGLAPYATIRQYLLWDRETGRFNEDVVDTFIRQFKGTLEFAGVNSSAKMSEENESSEKPIAVGDFVQWESQGAMQFAEPRRVDGFSDDGEWLFVDGSATGIPVKEVQRVDAPPNGKPDVPMTTTLTPPANPNFKPAPNTPLPAGTKEDKFTADTGEVLVRWPAILKQADYEDLEGWLDMLKRKIKRSVKADGDESQE